MFALFALFACTSPSSKDSDTGSVDTADSADSGGDTGPGTFQLSFSMNTDLIEDMDEAPVGQFRGSVFAEEDASATGPVDGAASLADFVSDSVDLSDGGPSTVAAEVGPLDPQVVWILGCLDTTGDDCECNDPVTFPGENETQLSSGDNAFTVRLDVLQPC